jgi:hypothetical protein
MKAIVGTDEAAGLGGMTLVERLAPPAAINVLGASAAVDERHASPPHLRFPRAPASGFVEAGSHPLNVSRSLTPSSPAWRPRLTRSAPVPHALRVTLQGCARPAFI